MFVLLNGPLGIGKSTLAEALGEEIEGCVTLSGDALAAINPPQADETAQVHAAMAALVAHHWAGGYRHFVIEHYWPTVHALADIAEHLLEIAPGEPVHCFRLVLQEKESRNRIARRQEARAIDDRAFEWESFSKEYALLSHAGDSLGQPFDVSGPVDLLVARMLRLLGLG